MYMIIMIINEKTPSQGKRTTGLARGYDQYTSRSCTLTPQQADSRSPHAAHEDDRSLLRPQLAMWHPGS